MDYVVLLSAELAELLRWFAWFCFLQNAQKSAEGLGGLVSRSMCRKTQMDGVVTFFTLALTPCPETSGSLCFVARGIHRKTQMK
jgi:hypothetical protein